MTGARLPFDYDYRIMDLDPQFADVFQPTADSEYSDFRDPSLSSPPTSPGMSGQIPQAGIPIPPPPPPPEQRLPPAMQAAAGYGLSKLPSMTQTVSDFGSAASDLPAARGPVVDPAAAGGLGDYALPALGAGLGAYGLYNTLSGDKTKAEGAFGGAASGAALGASIGSIFPGVGTLAGGGIGALAGGGLGGLFGKDKPHPEQLDREKALSQLGDISKGLNSRAYNVANNSMGTKEGQTVGALNPLSAILTSRQGAEGFNNPDPNKRMSDLTGMMTNSALGSGDPIKDITSKYAQAGLNHNSAYEAILKLREGGQISDDNTRDAYLAAIDKLYGVVNPNAPKNEAVTSIQGDLDKGKYGGNKPPTDYEMSARK